jgi:hypothetical protein
VAPNTDYGGALNGRDTTAVNKTLKWIIKINATLIQIPQYLMRY